MCVRQKKNHVFSFKPQVKDSILFESEIMHNRTNSLIYKKNQNYDPTYRKSNHLNSLMARVNLNKLNFNQ